MNKVIAMGRLTKDPEIRHANDTAVAKFTLAVDRRFKKDGQPTADFMSCTTFGKTAEFCERYLFKGTKILAEGELQNNNWTDKEGKKHYDMQIIVNQIEFAESKSKSKQESREEPDDDFSEPVDDERIPFE